MIHPISLFFDHVEILLAPVAAGPAGESGEPSLKMRCSVKPLEWRLSDTKFVEAWEV